MHQYETNEKDASYCVESHIPIGLAIKLLEARKENVIEALNDLASKSRIKIGSHPEYNFASRPLDTLSCSKRT
jgi:hypothetical protein